MRGEVNNEDGFCSSLDRISQLPEAVLHHILCFLSQKKAVQTSVLSKSWRHLGPTRPVIDLRGVCNSSHARRTKFCENCFCGNNEAFLSVVAITFQRYLDQNLSSKELRLQMSEDDSQSISVLEKWISIFINPDKPAVTTLHLSIDHYIYDADRKPDTWTCLELPSAVFKAESLENLYLHRCKITSIENVVFANLQKLTLSRVYIDDEALEKIMPGCPLVEYAELSYCKGFKSITVANQNRYLKDFKFVGLYVNGIELYVIEIDAPTLRSIHIETCLNWKLNPNNYFPHLKSLHLFCVQLSTESFENFSCNFPLLEEFILLYCGGFEEIKLFCPSLKHLTMRLNSSIKVDIDAPNILCFKFFCKYFPTTISFTTTSRDWKSKITLDNHNVFYNDLLPKFLELNEMVKALSKSEISLDISESIFYKSVKIECGIHDHVVVENLEIHDTGLNLNMIPSLFYALFQICRPRYVTTLYGLSSSRYTKGSVGSQLFGSGYVNESIDSQTRAECIWEVLIHEREKKEYYWQQHLEEVSIETFDFGERVWHRVQGTCLPECASKAKLIRFGLKWRECLVY